MPSRVDIGAAADRTISTLSGSLSTAGDAARNAGAAVRDRLRDSARAIERGGRSLRQNGVRETAATAAQGARRHRKRLLGTLGAVASGLLAVGVMRRGFRRARRR